MARSLPRRVLALLPALSLILSAACIFRREERYPCASDIDCAVILMRCHPSELVCVEGLPDPSSLANTSSSGGPASGGLERRWRPLGTVGGNSLRDRVVGGIIAEGSSGAPLLVWGELDGSIGELYGARFANGAWSGSEAVTPNNTTLSPWTAHQDRDGRAVVAWYTYNGLHWCWNDGEWSGPELLSPDAPQFQAAVNASGSASIAYRDELDDQLAGPMEIHVASRELSGSASAVPELVLPQEDRQGQGVYLAVNDAGERLVLWDLARRHIYASHFDGTAWSPREDVSRQWVGELRSQALHLTPAGKALLAWTEPQVGVFVTERTQEGVYGSIVRLPLQGAGVPTVAIVGGPGETSLLLWDEAVTDTDFHVWSSDYDGANWSPASRITSRALHLYGIDSLAAAIDETGRAVLLLMDETTVTVLERRAPGDAWIASGDLRGESTEQCCPTSRFVAGGALLATWAQWTRTDAGPSPSSTATGVLEPP